MGWRNAFEPMNPYCAATLVFRPLREQLRRGRSHPASLRERDVPSRLDEDRVRGVRRAASDARDEADLDGRSDAGAAGLVPRVAVGPDQGDDTLDLRQGLPDVALDPVPDLFPL